MKNSFYSKITTGALGIAMMAAPFATFAATTTPAVQNGVGANFCTTIDATGAKIISAIDTKSGTINSRSAKRLATLSDARQKRDETLSTKRAQRDTALNAHYTTLMKKANTDAQKAAVTTFKASTDAAIKARRDAIDAAIKIYRTGIDDLISKKFGTVSTDLATLKASANEALTKAKSSCTAGTDSKTVYTTFRSDIRTARDAYKTSHTLTKIKEDIKALSTTRKASVDTAISTFKDNMTAARSALKTALGAK